MTEKDIVKALENEVRLTEYVDSNYCDGIDLSLIKSALDLVNRQQAEIERLRKEVNLVSIQLLGIVFILLSVGVYWCIGESIFDKNIDIKE